ncbi:hypothetical protein AKO1_015007, partial [Acrasis kona]
MNQLSRMSVVNNQRIIVAQSLEKLKLSFTVTTFEDSTLNVNCKKLEGELLNLECELCDLLHEVVNQIPFVNHTLNQSELIQSITNQTLIIAKMYSQQVLLQNENKNNKVEMEGLNLKITKLTEKIEDLQQELKVTKSSNSPSGQDARAQGQLKRLKAMNEKLLSDVDELQIEIVELESMVPTDQLMLKRRGNAVQSSNSSSPPKYNSTKNIHELIKKLKSPGSPMGT